MLQTSESLSLELEIVLFLRKVIGISIYICSMTHYIISINIPLVDNAINIQLYQIHSVPVVNTMLQKILTIHLTNLYVATTDDEQY